RRGQRPRPDLHATQAHVRSARGNSVAGISPTGAMEFGIAGDGGHLRFEVALNGSRRADDRGYIWLPCECRCFLGPFKARFELSLCDSDLRMMKRDLESLTQDGA